MAREVFLCLGTGAGAVPLAGQVEASSLEADGGEEEEQEEVETHGVPEGGLAGTNTGMGLSLA